MWRLLACLIAIRWRATDMSLGPISTASAIALLQELSELKLVGTASDLQTALAQKPRAAPAAYVLVQEKGRPPIGLSGCMCQDIDVALQVVLFVRNAAKAESGSGAREVLDQVIAAVREALVGWQPLAKADPLWLQASRDEMLAGDWLVGQQVFASRYQIRVPT